jgi:hypothetical protein
MPEKPFLRNNFFTGKLLTAAELELEQDYFRGKLKLHNRALHGFGIVSGLEVSRRRDKLLITSGLALDCEGNEIVVPEKVIQPLPPMNSNSSAFLTIHYREQKTNPTPVVDAEELCKPALIVESFALTFETQNPNQHHRHEHGRWQACGKSHGLVLARLRQTSGNWRIDRRLRRPGIK